MINTNDNEIKVSIIVPSYNQGRFIENCILSILKQQYTNWELLIQDGGSGDETVSVCNRYANIDSRITFVSEKDRGFADAVNKGIARATGLICVIQSADDFFATESVFAEVNEIYRKDPTLWIIAGASIVVNEDLELLQTQERIEKFVPSENVFSLKDHFSQGATFFSLERARSVNALHDTVDMVADTHFWIKMSCLPPFKPNRIYQTSKIWGGVTVQAEQRSSDLSKFFFGRAEMAFQNVNNDRFLFDHDFKKQLANNLINDGINHFKKLSLETDVFLRLFKKLNDVDYAPEKSSLEDILKKIIKLLMLRRDQSSSKNNSKIEIFSKVTTPGCTVRWF